MKSILNCGTFGFVSLTFYCIDSTLAIVVKRLPMVIIVLVCLTDLIGYTNMLNNRKVH